MFLSIWMVKLLAEEANLKNEISIIVLYCPIGVQFQLDIQITMIVGKVHTAKSNNQLKSMLHNKLKFTKRHD